MNQFEKLGAFYLGKKVDVETQNLTDELILYDSKDLTTHALCVGMTGSGKTGLCISLLEEAAIDNIPALIIDPKGDMGNLMLTFPELSAEDLLPWVNESEANKKSLSKKEFAEKQSEFWKSGLLEWGQTTERIKNLRNNVEMNIYTPGSESGNPISILNSLSFNEPGLDDDEDLMIDRINSIATSLLGLLELDTDPLTSKEHILLSAVLNHYRKNGKNLDLQTIILAVQNPPFEKLGIFDLETFYPSKERFKLAMMINNLLASPAFASWMKGEPLDINNLLYTETGKPKISILYIAHLSDSERMFFVSLLLNQVIGWMRTQSGTSSLRALLYFDEIFGYLPPVGNPASKKPLLTLLKQARAFGLGLVLASQNPVDIDYKALSNMGTWIIGRLQTEQDQQRLLDGLQSSSSTISERFSKKQLSEIISSLGKRRFLLHNVHEDAPIVFNTRWALSYLAGPLTKNRIKELIQNHNQEIKSEKINKKERKDTKSLQPLLDSSIKQYFIPFRGSKATPESKLFYKPFIWAGASILFNDRTKKIDWQSDTVLITPLIDGTRSVDWTTSEDVLLSEYDLLDTPEENAEFDILPNTATQKKNYSIWEKQFKDYIYRNHKLPLLKSNLYKMYSVPNENERDFRIRLNQKTREQRDEWIEKLREKYSKKMLSIESKMKTAQQRIERETEQAKQQKITTAISIGTTLLGALFGRKSFGSGTASKAGTVLRGASRAMKESTDIKRAEESLEYLEEKLRDLELKFEKEVQEYSEKFDVMQEEFELISIYPKKTNISVNFFGLVWAPYWLSRENIAVKAWE